MSISESPPESHLKREQDKIYDFMVIGAGIAGASVAAQLAQSAEVCVIEAESQAGYHSTGRSAAMYVPGYGPPAVRMLTRASGDFLKNPPPAFTDTPLLSERAILLIATPEQKAKLALFQQEVESADIMTQIEADQIRDYQPLLRADFAVAGLLDQTGHDIDVDALHRGFLRQLKQFGGQLLTNTAVTALTRSEGVWHIQTKDQLIKSQVIINAAGAWAEEIGQMAGAETIGLVPKRRTALMIEADEGLDLASMPMTIDVDEQFYLKPEGRQILISPANEDPMPPCDVQPDEMDIAICIDRIERAFTLDIKSLKSKWAGLRSFVSDKEPVVGYSDKADGFFWLAGLGGYGIQTSPALGRMAAAVALGAEIPSDIAQTGLTPEMLHPARLQKSQPI